MNARKGDLELVLTGIGIGVMHFIGVLKKNAGKWNLELFEIGIEVITSQFFFIVICVSNFFSL